MPHTLEASPDAHQTLREAERVLRPEGRLLITGFNPVSLWGAARRISRIQIRTPLPWRSPLMDALRQQEWVGYWRLRDWLRLLNFEVEGARFGCYVPPVASAAWLRRLGWLEPLGDRWWPVFGSVYALMAVKRVRGMRLVELARRASTGKAPARVVAAQRRQRSMPPDFGGADG